MPVSILSIKSKERSESIREIQKRLKSRSKSKSHKDVVCKKYKKRDTSPISARHQIRKAIILWVNRHYNEEDYKMVVSYIESRSNFLILDSSVSFNFTLDMSCYITILQEQSGEVYLVDDEMLKIIKEK